MSLSDFKNCKGCQVVFKPTEYCRSYCRPCSLKNEVEFSKIKDLIHEHGELNALEISAISDIPIDTVLDFVDDYRLGHKSHNNDPVAGPKSSYYSSRN